MTTQLGAYLGTLNDTSASAQVSVNADTFGLRQVLASTRYDSKQTITDYVHETEAGGALVVSAAESARPPAAAFNPVLQIHGESQAPFNTHSVI